ncbi:MAG: class I SAM-dependent methyltransferase [Acidimicrobiales bacterium]
MSGSGELESTGLASDPGAGTDGFVVLADKTGPDYSPNYKFPGAVINTIHREIHASVEAVPGWLQPEDSLKLYELAYFSHGPILEVGTYFGKSTAIIASALRDARSSASFLSLDIDGEALAAAAAMLAQRRVDSHVQLVRGSLDALFRVRPDLRPALVFLDGDHTFKGVRRDLAALHDRVPSGGLLLFHDYVDTRYGVSNAVAGSWVSEECDFAGAFGCAALFRRTTDPAQRTGAHDAPPIVNLIELAPWSVRIRSEVIAPTVAKLGVRRLRDRLAARRGR